MTVVGNYSTPCNSHPKITVLLIDETKKVLALRVETQLDQPICSDVTGRTFEVVYDLKSLPLKVGNTYSVQFQNYAGDKNETVYQAVSSNYNAADYDLNAKDFRGTIVYYQDPNAANTVLSLKEDKEIVPVVSPEMLPALEQFAGEVQVTGYEINIATLDGGTDSPSKVIIPVSVSQ
jgi:hypothetical protein